MHPKPKGLWVIGGHAVTSAIGRVRGDGSEEPASEAEEAATTAS